MFRRLHNQVQLGFEIRPFTPLLIKSGRVSFDPTRPDMDFVRSTTVFGEVPYLPGSSLKGVIRSYGERIFRSLSLIDCDITVRNKACFPKSSDDRKMDVEKKYQRHCYACRTFGSTEMAGRLTLTDAYPWPVDASKDDIENVVYNIDENVPTESRMNVRIDRRTGTSAGAALFEAEVVTGGAFYGEINLTNYQLWQLALLGLIFRDINSGLLRLGGAKTRGLGRVGISINRLEFHQYGELTAAGKGLKGVGCLDEKTARLYGLTGEDYLEIPTGIIQDKDDSVPGVLEVYKAGRGKYGEHDEPIEPDNVWQSLARQLIHGKCWKEFLKSGGNYAKSE